MTECIEIDRIQIEPLNTDNNIPALDLGDSQIPFDRLIDRLQEFQLLPQLITEIAIDEAIEIIALNSGLNLDYDAIEFEELYAQIQQSRSVQGMNLQQLTAITDRELKIKKFKRLQWGHLVEKYFTLQQRKLDRVTLSIVKVADPLVARELFFCLQAQERSFAEIALEYSQDNYRQTG